MIVLPGLNCPGLAPNLTIRQIQYMVAIQGGLRKYRALAKRFGVQVNAARLVVNTIKRKGRVEGHRSAGTLRVIRPLQWREIA